MTAETALGPKIRSILIIILSLGHELGLAASVLVVAVLFIMSRHNNICLRHYMTDGIKVGK